VRELQNLILTSVLFCDAPEVDVDDLQGFAPVARPAAGGPRAVPVADARPERAPDRKPSGLPSASDLEPRLRKALAGAINAARASGSHALAPIGKWLSEDLVLAADRLSEGVSRRGAALLGLPESTYRRQLQSGARRRAAGLAVRSPWWPAVAGLLDDVILSRPSGRRVLEWAEACLLAEIESAMPGDARSAATLLGVTAPTLFRRKAHWLRHYQ
jgi:hypothetical protein